MVVRKHSKEMEDNIRNYGQSIRTMESIVEFIRKRPGTLIGDIGNTGFLTLFREIFQNAIDELVKLNSPCDHITVSYDERTHTFIVEDNGRGIPFDDMIRIFTSEWTSSNYDKQEGDWSAGMNGIGAKAAMALSLLFTVEAYILGEARKITFTDGNPGEVEVIPCNGKQGTVVTYAQPLYEVLGEITVKASDIRDLINKILMLTPIGSTVDFNYITLSGKPHSEKLVNTDGIITDLILKTEKPIVMPITISNGNGIMTCDIAFTYDSDLTGDTKEDITGFANFCPTRDGGTHIDGLLEGVIKFFKDYMNKIYLKSNSKITVTNSDIKTSLKAIIAVKHIEPIFEGQSKTKFNNLDMIPFVKDTVAASLNEWSKTNPGDLQKLCKFFKDIAEIRIKGEEGKIKITKSYEASAITGLPKKYTKPSGKIGPESELLIPEGDSAAGSAKDGRCTRRQGVFPIRGKIPNAFTTEKSKFLSNEEISGIIEIIGGGYGKHFKIENVKWGKIVMLPDADADGAHIRTLLMSFFLMYMPQLFTHGKVFAAVPPLFGIVGAKGKVTHYFRNKLEYITHIQRQFTKSNKIATVDGIELSSKEITTLLYVNIDYVYDLELVATRYALETKLLEYALWLRKQPDALKKLIEKEYRFMKYNTKTNVAEGLIGSKYNTLVLNDKILKDCENLCELIDIKNGSTINYLLNGERATLYDIMKAFEKATPNNMIRYKGLGEMDAAQLSESTIHPDSDRMLVQVTIEDAAKELELVRAIQSNKNELLAKLSVSRHDIY